jgi:TPR repeat protein
MRDAFPVLYTNFDGVSCLVHVGREGYAEGWGVRKNSRRAFEWYLQAARDGHPEALYFVGVSYLYGEGVTKDEAEAFQWLRRSAAAGDLTGAYMEALSVFEGRGTVKQPRIGMSMLVKAARRGSGAAMDFLASISMKKGRLRAARTWATRAVESGDQVAPLRLSEIDRMLIRGSGRKQS